MSRVSLFPAPRTLLSWCTLGLSTLAILILVTVAPPAAAKPKMHTVYSGQRLGSIAKRYNVTVEDLCKANGISRKDAIHPGQKLVIPGTDDGTPDASAEKPRSANDKTKAEPGAIKSKPQGKTRVHVVEKGHTLSAIAGRYAVTVGSLCYANDIPRNASLSVGQKLLVPHKTDEGGAYARKQRDRGDFDEPESSHDSPASPKAEAASNSTSSRSWMPFVKPAWKRGFIKIRRYERYWEGYVIGPNGEVLGHASNKINFVLGAKSDGPRIDPALIRLIASISDKFGGRELRIVSGYRTRSFVAASQHKQGRALDFSIPGVPNEALRDYLRTLDDVGVGYYPNSSFVHLDVRGYNSYWIDYAGPGEAPRKSNKKASKKKRARSDGESDDQRSDDTPDGGEADLDGDSKSSSPDDMRHGHDENGDEEYSHGDPAPEQEPAVGEQDAPEHAED